MPLDVPDKAFFFILIFGAAAPIDQDDKFPPMVKEVQDTFGFGSAEPVDLTVCMPVFVSSFSTYAEEGVEDEFGYTLEHALLPKGLYGAGEVTWQSGGYSQSVVFGRISGQEAAACIQEN